MKRAGRLVQLPLAAAGLAAFLVAPSTVDALAQEEEETRGLRVSSPGAGD